MKTKLMTMGVACTMVMASCQNPAGEATSSASEETKVDSTVAVEEAAWPDSYEKDGLKIYPAGEGQAFTEASLKLVSPENGTKIEGDEASFSFEVAQYELGAQTDKINREGLANSGKGQHIHLIVDNGPYSAHYEPSFTKEVTEGNHVAIAFLSRSFHESVKNGKAYQVFQFSKGENTESADLSDPLLFYSRPKGTYTGDDAKKVLFDFFVVNADLAQDGYSVLMTVNDTHEFRIGQWQPYFIEGLPMGENTISISLLDAEGNVVESAMNGTTRAFTLEEAATE